MCSAFSREREHPEAVVFNARNMLPQFPGPGAPRCRVSDLDGHEVRIDGIVMTRIHRAGCTSTHLERRSPKQQRTTNRVVAACSSEPLLPLWIPGVQHLMIGPRLSVTQACKSNLTTTPRFHLNRILYESNCVAERHRAHVRPTSSWCRIAETHPDRVNAPWQIAVNRGASS